MKRTSVGALAGTYLFLLAATAILTWRFYGLLPPVPAAGALTVWLLVVVVGTLIVIRRRGDVGLDRTQLDPITVARMMVVGKASAWTGAVLGGIYSGVAGYVLAQAGNLVAAQNETPAVVAAALGSIALAVAGVVLERHCEAPPPLDGETVG